MTLLVSVGKPGGAPIDTNRIGDESIEIQVEGDKVDHCYRSNGGPRNDAVYGRVKVDHQVVVLDVIARITEVRVVDIPYADAGRGEIYGRCRVRLLVGIDEPGPVCAGRSDVDGSG